MRCTPWGQSTHHSRRLRLTARRPNVQQFDESVSPQTPPFPHWRYSLFEPQKRSCTVFSKAVSQPFWGGQSAWETNREALTTLSSNVNPLAGVIAQNLSCTHSVAHIDSVSTGGIRILVKTLTLYHVSRNQRPYWKPENRRSFPSQRPCRNA